MKPKTTPSREARAARKRPAADVPSPEAPSASSSPVSRFLPWAIVLLVILLAAAVRIRLLDIPLERDEGEYAYAGQLLLDGTPPYREAFNMKFPGVYGAYAVIMAIFGQTIAGIHLGFLFLNAGTVVLVFLLGRRLFNAEAGAAAAAAYAMMSLGAGVFGTQAHATHFVIAAALGATLLLLRGIDNGSLATLSFSGLLYGVAILMKQPGAIFAIFGGVYLLASGRRRGDAGPVTLRKFLIWMLGAGTPLVLTALALWYAGVFPRFWFWTVTYARQYLSETSLDDGIASFTSTFPLVAGPNLLLWLLAAAGLVALFWKNNDRTARAFVLAFLVCSCLAICPGWFFRGHYFVLVLPAIALLTGVAVSSARNLGWLALTAALAISIFQQRDFLFRWSPLEASRQMFGYTPFPEAIPIAAYLRAHTDRNARIAVLGSEPEIYFYAHRLSATGYIYTYGMMEPQPFALAMQNEMISQLESARPEYVVLINMQSSWLRRPNSYTKVDEWWSRYSDQHYRLIGAADIQSPERTIYYWENLEAYHPAAQLITIFKRTGK